ncbi:MAG: deoxyguanosinetriphosphate triphosphohydrolase [Proteobacteria bacterium]|nr:deoxyguanosinetriphosphate triphosphohydrolase [Pseudomonadota bacterium]
MRIAPYASKPDHSRGRLYPEPPSATRTAFQRDRDRIIHCTAFRRLMHKTQVFVHHEGDHYRTRLTHSLEVAQIARSISRVLAIDEDLTEALALAHDLGHPPFGHAGETALNQVMSDYGGFDHNAQTLRILTRLEARYPDFDGLNLTWETLEGVVKHNGPFAQDETPPAIAAYVAGHDLEITTHAGLEAQIAALADDIAYDNHDMDDGLRARLFTVADISEVAIARDAFDHAEQAASGAHPSRLVHGAVRHMIGAMVVDVIAETERRLESARPADAAALRALDRPMAAFSEAMAAREKELKAFLAQHMYSHPRVTVKREVARRVLRELFGYYRGGLENLPDGWRQAARDADEPRAARMVADYIAGMTDRYAVVEYNRAFDNSLEI